MNCDFCTAAMALLARFDHFFVKSSQVPLHEAFTHKTGFSQSSPIKANQGKSRHFCEISLPPNPLSAKAPQSGATAESFRISTNSV
jgi:hypothetical protein